MTVIELAPEQAAVLVSRLVTETERLHLETKRVSGKMVSKALDTVCAFANSEGGTLVLGLEDADKAKGRKRLIGIEENPEAVDELQRKLLTAFLPPIQGVQCLRLSCQRQDGSPGHLLAIHVPRSNKVHSVIDGGTWKRLERSNRAMSADEVHELMLRRGVVSAETDLLDVPLSLLDTPLWRDYCESRGLITGDTGNRLERIQLAKRQVDKLLPTRAAILLFADFPSDILAANGGTRAGIRIFHYEGTNIEHGVNPNLKKAPRTVAGPLIQQINDALDYVINEIGQGLVMAKSGFRTAHRYPERVIKEAITNAVIHRDYRYPRDVQIRIFDNRIEIESPGDFPANITPLNIRTARSSPRNPMIAMHLREFSAPPNVDAGEGVPMMFATMQTHGLFPPQYSITSDSAIPAVTVTLLNEERPAIWEQVSDWIDRHGALANRDLRTIAGVETLEASRMLKGWVEHGLLIMDDSRGKKHTVYRKNLSISADDTLSLFSSALENKDKISLTP